MLSANRLIIRIILILTVIAISSASASWQIVKLTGKDYVTVKSMKSFYAFTEMKRSGKSISLEHSTVKLTMRVGSQECFMNKVKFVLSNPIIENSGRILISRTDLTKLIDPVLRPSHITNAGNFRTVILDAGHGGEDPGAINQYGTEAGYNLIVARQVRNLLVRQGYNVIMTRNSNVTLSRPQRVAFANRHKNAIFISIHFNAANNKKARGIETFTLSPVGVAHYGRNVKSSDRNIRKGNYQDSANIALATAIHGRTLERTASAGISDRGIKRARFDLLTSLKHPAILIEGGFMSNPIEAKIIHSPIYQRTISHAISEGIVRYHAALNNRRR